MILVTVFLDLRGPSVRFWHNGDHVWLELCEIIAVEGRFKAFKGILELKEGKEGLSLGKNEAHI